MTQQLRTKNRYLSFIGLSVILIFHAATFLAIIWRASFVVEGVRYFSLADDAMISMRYAYNLAAGQGLVWNPGEYVHGITNLGWTLIMAFIHLAGLPLALNSLVVQLLNLVIQVGLISYVFGHLFKRAGLGAALGAALLMAISSPLLIWGAFGFETSLQALLISLAFLRVVPTSNGNKDFARNLYLAPPLCALAFLVRPDSIVFFALAVGLVIYLFYFKKAPGEDKTRAGLAITAGLGVIIAVLFFQRFYYGDWLPNTFRLKATEGAASSIRGLKYLNQFTLSEFFYFPFLLAAGLYLVQGLFRRQVIVYYAPITLAVLTWFAYVTAVGGDAFPYGRFYIPVVPILIVLTVLYARSLLADLYRMLRAGRGLPHFQATRVRQTLSFVLQVLILISLSYLFYWHLIVFHPVSLIGKPSATSVNSVKIAIALQKAGLPTDDLVALYFAGTIPYFMPQYRFHDLLGKSDKHIAQTSAHPGPPGHNKWDYRYSLDVVKPDIIISAAPYWNASEEAFQREVADQIDYAFHANLWLDPTFKEKYRSNQINLVLDGEMIYQYFWLYAHQETHLDQLDDSYIIRGAVEWTGYPLVRVIAPPRSPVRDINVDFRYPSWGLGSSASGTMVWLGQGEAQGLRGTISPDQKLTILAIFEVARGPAGLEGPRTVQLTLKNKTGEQLTRRQFDQVRDLVFTLNLQPGPNEFSFGVLDEPTTLKQSNGDTRPLLAVLRSITVAEAPSIMSDQGAAFGKSQ